MLSYEESWVLFQERHALVSRTKIIIDEKEFFSESKTVMTPLLENDSLLKKNDTFLFIVVSLKTQIIRSTHNILFKSTK